MNEKPLKFSSRSKAPEFDRESVDLLAPDPWDTPALPPMAPVLQVESLKGQWHEIPSFHFSNIHKGIPRFSRKLDYFCCCSKTKTFSKVLVKSPKSVMNVSPKMQKWIFTSALVGLTPSRNSLRLKGQGHKIIIS